MLYHIQNFVKCAHLRVPSLLPTTTRSLTLSPMACSTVLPEILFVPALYMRKITLQVRLPPPHSGFRSQRRMELEYLAAAGAVTLALLRLQLKF